MDTVLINADRLKKIVSNLFEKQGLSPCDAEAVAEFIVLQEMRGVVTHGLRRIGPNLKGLQGGWIKAVPKRSILNDQYAIAIIDGDNGIGMLGCLDAMEKAIHKAQTYGIGMVTIINNNHFQSAGPYCMEAVKHDMIGIALSNTNASMGYPGTLKRIIGNSPFGFGIPTKSDFPIVFDSSLTISGGKLEQYIREHGMIPEYLSGLDAEGNSTKDPGKVLYGGTPMPIGGYKGSGIAILIEVLTGVISGGAFLKDIISPEQRLKGINSESQCCIAIDINKFINLTSFKERMAKFIIDIKDNPLALGYTEILLPGERAYRKYKESLEMGVPVTVDMQIELSRWGAEFD